jgi:hypothetical protein
MAVDKAVTVEPVGEFTLKGSSDGGLQCARGRGFKTQLMSAYGTKRASNCRPAMSAFGGKADMTRA